MTMPLPADTVTPPFFSRALRSLNPWCWCDTHMAGPQGMANERHEPPRPTGPGARGGSEDSDGRTEVKFISQCPSTSLYSRVAATSPLASVKKRG